MKRIHVIAAASAAIFSLGCGVAVAQNVSGGNSYEQGYAAGASAKQQNSFSTFDNGYRAGQADQSSAQNSASVDAYAQGYQAGMARASRDQQQAYNEGYADRAVRRIGVWPTALSMTASMPAPIAGRVMTSNSLKYR